MSDGGPPTPHPLPSVLIEKRKWDGSVSARWKASIIERPPGPWCWFTARGTIRSHPRSGRVEVVGSGELALAGEDWWVLTAHIDGDGAIDRIKVDAATPVGTDLDGCLWFCDLDIDLLIGPSGIELCDEDDYTRNAATMGYPAGMRDRADRALADVTARHATRDWPFDGTLDRLAAAAVGSPGRTGPSA